MKKSLTDRIEEYLKVLIERSGQKKIEIQRAELAETFNCVPSQVTYVIGTRFTEEDGYLTESRRGGKGFVRIICTNSDLSETALTNLNDLILYIGMLKSKGKITAREDRILKYLASHSTEAMKADQKVKFYIAFQEALDDLFAQD